MLSFLLRQTLRIILILVGVELLIFLLVHQIPGSPWDTPSNQEEARRATFTFYADTATLERLSNYYGLDLPPWRQFTRYLIGDVLADKAFVCGIVCGNMGLSIRQGGRSVQDILFAAPEGRGRWESRAGYTLRLVSLSFLLVAFLGIPLGVASAFWIKSWFDKTLSTVLTTVSSIPIFVLGLLSILIFGTGLKWLKVIPDWTQPKYWIIPTSLLVMIPLSNFVRLTRAAVLDAMSGDYIRTARAKGLTRSKTIWVHVLPNALIAILTFLLPIFVELFAASFIVEAIFGFPGFGREYWHAIGDLDFALIMGITFLYACGIAFTSLILETLYRLVDPRMRLP
jgi:oligopeptide transport system permease protein